MTNITETMEDGKPSLITSVQVETATHGDCAFLPDAVSNSERVTEEDVREIHADGAYQSPDNLALASEKDFRLKTGKMQGGCRFVLNLTEGTDELMVTDTTTDKVIQAVYVGRTEKHGRRWRIKPSDVSRKYPWRYFTEKEVDSSALRQQIQSQDPRNSQGGTTWKRQCSSTASMPVMERPDTEACSSIACMHSTNACG